MKIIDDSIEMSGNLEKSEENQEYLNRQNSWNQSVTVEDVDKGMN